MTGWIAAITALLGMIYVFIWRPISKAFEDSHELKIKEVEDEAKKIVDSKTDSELVDDFNKRFPGGGPG